MSEVIYETATVNKLLSISIEDRALLCPACGSDMIKVSGFHVLETSIRMDFHCFDCVEPGVDIGFSLLLGRKGLGTTIQWEPRR